MPREAKGLSSKLSRQDHLAICACTYFHCENWSGSTGRVGKATSGWMARFCADELPASLPSSGSRSPLTSRFSHQ